LELVLHRVHPDDSSAVEQLIERISHERAPFDFEHRLLMPMDLSNICGSWAVLRERIGLPGVRGNGYGHHERKRAEDVIRESEKALRLMVDGMLAS